MIYISSLQYRLQLAIALFFVTVGCHTPGLPRVSEMSTSVDTERISDATSHWPSPSQRPSYFDFLSTTGLRPAQHSFDEGVIRNLDLDLFDDSGNSDGKSADEEKLKTFLRIRPSTQSGGGSGKHVSYPSFCMQLLLNCRTSG